MFWRKKGKKNIGTDEELDGGVEDELPSFSWWTPWKKAVLAAAAAACVTGIGLGVRSCESEAERKAGYQGYVRSVTSEYDRYPVPAMVTGGCLIPGTDARVFRDSLVLYTMQSNRSEFTVADNAKNASSLCIRPVDGGQEVELESRVRISRIDYGDVEGYLQYRTGLKLVPDIPDILPHEFSIREVTVNGKAIPQRFVEKRGPDAGSGVHYYVDLARLVEGGVLSEDDFSQDLEVRIRSAAAVSEVPQLSEDDVAGLDAYAGLPGHMERYTKSTSAIPSGHKRIKSIVDGYDGPDNVLEMIRYALDFTDRKIEYYRPELGLSPIEVIDDGRGDCDDYAGLFVTILRAFGIPSRTVSGDITDIIGYSVVGAHAWTEVYVPFRDGSYRWVLVEPTWADGESDPYRYINLTSPKFMYNIRFNVSLDTERSDQYDVFQEHHWVSRRTGEEMQASPPVQLLLPLFIEGGGWDEEE